MTTRFVRNKKRQIRFWFLIVLFRFASTRHYMGKFSAMQSPIYGHYDSADSLEKRVNKRGDRRSLSEDNQQAEEQENQNHGSQPPPFVTPEKQQKFPHDP